MADQRNSRSKPPSKGIVNPFMPLPSKIAQIESGMGNDDSKELQPPLVPPPEHHHPLSLVQKIALGVITFAAIASKGTETPAEPVTTSLVLAPRSTSSADHQEPASSREGRDGEDLRKVAQLVFEHFVDESIDEALEAIAERYEELLRHKGHFTHDEQQEFDDFPPPTNARDGRSIFECAWKLMRPVVCGDQDARSASSDEAFGLASTIALKGADIVSPRLAMWAGIFGACLSIVRKTGIEGWCRET